MEKKYPIGGYAPGNYQCACVTCRYKFEGDKRAVQCESCAVASLRELLKPYDQPPADADPPTPQGIGWVKGAPKEMKPHYAKVPSKLYANIQYKAIIIPKGFDGHWWAVGDGFAFDLKSEEIIEYLDESQPQPGREGEFAEWVAALYKFKDGMWEDDDGLYYSTAQLLDKFKEVKP